VRPGSLSTASGLDIYFPACSSTIPARSHPETCADWLENRGIDDAVGAVTVHGDWSLWCGLLGIWAGGYPALRVLRAKPDDKHLLGQIVGAIVFFFVASCQDHIVFSRCWHVAHSTPEALKSLWISLKVPAAGCPLNGDGDACYPHPAE
jgi:hypothetical protein